MELRVPSPEELEGDASSAFPAPTNQQESSTTTTNNNNTDSNTKTTPIMIDVNHVEEGDEEELDQNDSLDTWLDEAVSSVSKDELDNSENNDSHSNNTHNSSSSPSALDFMMGIATPTPTKEIHHEKQKSPMVKEQEQDDGSIQLCQEKEDGGVEEKKDEDSSVLDENSITGDGGGTDEVALSAESTVPDATEMEDGPTTRNVIEKEPESAPEINDILISASKHDTKDVSEDGVDTFGDSSTIPSAPEAVASNDITKVLTDSKNDPVQVHVHVHVAKGDETNEREAMDSPISPQNKEQDTVHDLNDHNEITSDAASPSKPAQDTPATPAPQDQQPSSKSTATPTPTKMFRNRFANWKSKAEDALQNTNQVLKIAQKNIEETNKKVQKAVENNINIGGLGVGSGTGSGVNTNKAKGGDTSNSGARKFVDPDDVEDDLSYESGGRSIGYEGGSQSSSVYVDSSDDASYSSCSDTSSVYANQSPSRGRRGSDSEGSQSLHSNKSKKNSPSRRALRPRALTRRDSSVPSTTGDATPVLKNSVPVVPSIRGTSPSTYPASSYKGRYEEAGQSQSRANILKTLQRKVRVPSPEPPTRREIKPPRKEERRQESQLELMQRIIPGPKINDILKSMSRGQYLMLLRPGMLGVNLKQTYLSGHGVYVDFILPGGNAESSGVICVGDGLVKVGDVDISRGTIFDVPGIIGKSRRPAILILNGEHSVKLEDMDYLNVAIGVVNRMLDEACNGMNRSAIDEIPFTSESNSYLIPENPPLSLRTQVEGCSSQRNNQRSSFSTISAACQQDSNLQEILRRAFRICCVDNRRLPFFAAFLSSDDAFNADGSQPQYLPSEITASTRLMLYLELVTFRDLFTVASPQRRVDHAKLIAAKFLLPSDSDDPLFDLRPMFPVDVINDFREAISDLNTDANTIGLSLFRQIERCLEDSLAGSKFAYFLLSDECARMRAYMRSTSSYIDPPLGSVIRDSSLICSKEFASARNHMKYVMVYLLYQKEKDTIDKNFDTTPNAIDKESNRLKGSAGGLSCAIFISRVLLVSTMDAMKAIKHENKESCDAINTFIGTLEIFWESYIAPEGGILDSSSYSNETYNLIEKTRDFVLDAVEIPEDTKDEDRLLCIARSLVHNEVFLQNLEMLRDELTHDYYVNHHTKYKAHIIHEWMCTEASTTIQDSSREEIKSDSAKLNGSIPALSDGSISRLMRKLDIPKGVSRHCPVHMSTNVDVKKKQMESAKCNFNADFAVVFIASDLDDNIANTTDSPPIKQMTSFDQSSFQRISSTPLSAHAKHQAGKIPLDQMFPATIVSYAMVPPLKNRPFQESINFGRDTQNGWEVSIVNFMAPNANKRGDDDMTDFLYGVSLVLNQITEVQGTKQTKQVVALSLISERSVIPAMRRALVKLYEEKVASKPNNRDCTSLVEALSKLRAEGDNSATLKIMLEPYIKIGSSPWIDKPLSHQMAAFERSCLEVLVESLSPVPLSLLLITALLEQKIVFVSNRRSSLVSTVAALRSLLRPLGWSHLIVPTAPSSLASDLVQYPAPFIIGIPLDSTENKNIIKTLPDDITLVDVDVGRVILTKNFSHHSTGETDGGKATASALRSQVLHLAESLGNVIGGYQSDSVWRCDSPLSDSFEGVNISRKVEAVQKIARAFILELTAGINTCCYWVEEESNAADKIFAEQNILFDEDRFLHLKQLRSERAYSTLFDSEDLARANHQSSLEARPILALDLNDFDLVMDTFLRGQSMSSFISSQRKETMPYW